MSTLDSIRRGVAASAVGTLALDASVYRQYLHDGGTTAFAAWESSEGVDTWEAAPAPAQVARKLLEAVLGGEVPARYARSLNNLTHWGFGLTMGAVYGLLMRDRQPKLRYGPPFGAAVWAQGYVVFPVLGVYEPIWKYNIGTLAKDLRGHLVFGTTTAAVYCLLARKESS
jgi:hypothetical protein